MGRTRLLSLFVVLGLLVAACGDDDTSTATDDSVEGSEDTTETTAEDPDDGDGGVDEDAMAESLGECGFLTGFATAFEDFDPTAMYSGEEATDFGQLFAPLAEAARDVADDAPSEIQDAFRTVAEGFAAVAEELDGVVIDLTDPEAMDPEAMAKLESLETSFGEDFESASTEIDTWMSENCADIADGFDLGGFGS